MAREDSIIRGFLNKGRAVRNIEEPWWSKRYGDILGGIAELPDVYNKAKIYTGNKLDDTYKSLLGLLDAADSEAGMKIYEKNLNEFTSEAQKFGGFDDNIIQAETLKLIGNQKDQMRINFSDGVQKASDFIDSPEYLSKQSDFENLPDMVKAINVKRIAADKNPYEGTLQYLVSEKERTLSLMDKILPGMQFNKDRLIVGTNFTYNKAERKDGSIIGDKEVARKIVQYYNRIELTTKTLEGDGIITPDEAKAILIGNMDDYIKKRDTALTREKGNYTGNKALFARYSGYVNMARQKSLQALQDNFTTAMPGDMGDSEYAIMGEELKALAGLGEDATEDDWKSIISSLEMQRDGYKALMNTANEKYKYWSGGYYEGGGEADDEFMIAELAKQMGVTPDRYREIQKGASDRGMDIDEFIVAEKEAFAIDEKLTPTQEQEKFEEFRETLPPLGAGRTVVGEGATAKRYPTEIVEPEVTLERNNPGNLKFANQTDAVGKDKLGFAVFNTAEEGWQALYNQIDADKNRNDTLHEFIYGKGDGDYGYTATDRESYEKSLSKQLNLSPNAKIDTVSTKKLANAIAKQEGYAAEFPAEKKVKGVVPLTKVQDGKTVVNYDIADTHNFKKQQVNLQDIASNKFKSLSKDDKKNYGNVRDFVKAKYEEWLKKTGKHGKGAWYSEGDFKYFFPTKVGPKGTLTNISGVDIYDLFDRRINKHPAFKKVKGFPAPPTTSASYKNFAKDFDDFRKFLQEA